MGLKLSSEIKNSELAIQCRDLMAADESNVTILLHQLERIKQLDIFTIPETKLKDHDQQTLLILRMFIDHCDKHLNFM